jgi:hypothetical protein
VASFQLTPIHNHNFAETQKRQGRSSPLSVIAVKLFNAKIISRPRARVKRFLRLYFF